MLEKSSIEMYSIKNEEKSVVAETFIRTLKNKIYKHMTMVCFLQFFLNEMFQ